MKKQLFGLLLVGLALGGCAEMLIAELAVMGASVATSSPSSTSNGSTSATQSTLIAAPSYKNWGDEKLCQKSTYRGHWDTQLPFSKYADEAKRRGLSWGVGVLADTQITWSATTPTKTAVAHPTNTSQPEAIPSTISEASMTVDQSLKSRSAENKALQISVEEMPSSAILMICKTIKHADRLTQGVPVFHLNFDGGAQFLKWNSLTADILEVADEKITAHLEPPKGSFIRPLLTLDRYSGTFIYQPWGGHGMYHGKCELAEAKKKLF